MSDFRQQFDAATADGYGKPERLSAQVLRIQTCSGQGYIYHLYDFSIRLLTTTHGEKSVFVTPFAQLDREVLETLHAKLAELGGKPPALPKADGLGKLSL